jgi:hypothetical protein
LENDVGCPTTTTKMVWRLERQVHHLLITTIWGGGRRCAIRLQKLEGCCALAIVTSTLVVVALAVPRTTLNLQAIENKQEQDKKQTLTDLIELGFYFKYPGSLADTRVYKEVAKAKLTSNKNPSYLVAASCLNRGIERVLMENETLSAVYGRLVWFLSLILDTHESRRRELSNK